MPGRVRKGLVLSLRSAMLLVLLSGMWSGWRVNRANDQRRAVAAIRRAGGGISYSYPFLVWKGYRNPNARPWAPAWLRNWLGDEFFQEVISVQFFNRPLTDHDLAPLASLDCLEELAISGAPITDGGLKYIANLKELRTLHLWETPGITDAGIAHLSSLTKLQTLALYRCSITDASLVHLRTMDNLEMLDLAETGVMGPGLSHLDRMAKLKRLFTPTNRAGLTHIGRLHGLQELYAYDTRKPIPGDPLTDLTDLAGLKSLRVLVLGDNLCSDTGLATLSGLSGLTRLGIGGERVTDAGLNHIAKLKRLFTPTNRAGLAHIGRLYGLQELYAYDTRMPTPCDGLTDLAGLKGLRVLILGDNLCSDTGLATLSGLSGLTQLGIGGERVTDAGLSHLAKLKGLQELTVYKSRVTGAGLAVLLDLPNLTSLDLQDSARVGDSGVEPLKKLTGLRTLGLVGTTVNEAGMTVIRQALPTARVVR